MIDPPAVPNSAADVRRIARKPHRTLITRFPVVLDACVLSNATVRDFVLWAADLALFRPIWSSDIIAETRRTLTGFGIAATRIDYLLQQMSDAFPEAPVDGYQHLIGSLTNHPNDRHVVAAAILAGAQVIVTENLKHFPEKSLSPYHVEASNADEFLRDLLDIDSERMIEVLMTIATHRKCPPKTVDELLEALENNGCFGFAQDLRDALKQRFGDS
jgi:PIN domain-containing protein